MPIRILKDSGRAALLGLFLWAAQADAVPVPITTLFNTGVNATNTGLAADGSVDLHYQLVASADPAGGPGPSAYVVPAGAYQPPWIPNGPTSKWINPRNPATNLNNGNNSGSYTYRLVFNMTGLNAGTGMITGRWATDNIGSIIFNGVSQPPATQSTGFSAYVPFTIMTGFLPTLNTIDFVVINGQNIPGAPGNLFNPTGLRVEISGTAEPIVVGLPEPGIIALLGFGLGLTGFVGVRRRLKKS